MSDDITNRFLRAVDSGWRTAEEAAEELGIHPTLISQFRAGIRVPDEPLARLAETYAEAHNPPAHVLGEADPGDDLAQLDPLIESLQVMASKGDHKERLGPQSALILAKMRRRENCQGRGQGVRVALERGQDGHRRRAEGWVCRRRDAHGPGGCHRLGEGADGGGAGAPHPGGRGSRRR